MLEELHPGKIFHGRYEIVRCIRAGGMGAVYEVIHLETRRHRAMKVMLPAIVRDEAMRNRFRLEAQVTADVESDHIVETFDAGVDGETGAPFLVMELLRGEDLGHHLRARTTLPREDVVGLLSQLARALEQTHAAGIVHRDLKPENLFLAVRGDDPPRLKVLDFGIAKIVQSSSEAGTTSIGTPLYMAPEQLQGANVSPRTDLFTVGHIAFTLLTGKAYWADEADMIGILPLIDRISRGAEEPTSARAARRGVDLPLAFDAWFARSTARVAADRFETAREQAAALGDALGVTPQRATIPMPVVATAAQLRRNSLPDVETAAAPLSLQSAELAGRGRADPRTPSPGRSPMSRSEILAPTSRSGSIRAAAISGTPHEVAEPATLVAERQSINTHHESVRNVPAPAAGTGARAVIIGAVVLGILGGGALALFRRVPAETPAAEVLPASPPALTMQGATAPPNPAPTAPAPAAPETAATATSSPPVPRVDPAQPAPPASAAPSPATSAPSAPRPRATAAPAAAAVKPPTPAAKRDPTKVFD